MAEPTRFYDYTTVVTKIDRKIYGKRTVPMKVLVLGLGRTGTDSLRKALKLLGLNDTYHGYSCVIDNPLDCEMWLEALEAKFEGKGAPYGRAEFDKLLGHCQAVSDQPAILFSKELIEAYPQAKVILTQRDEDAWYYSNLETLDARAKPQTVPVTMILALTNILSSVFKLHTRFVRITWQKAWFHMFQGDFEANGKRVYRSHNDMIRSLVPKEQLLEYRIQEGWGPLCKFLGEPIPEFPFPTGNEKKAFKLRFRGVWLRTIRAIAARLFGVGLVGYILNWARLKRGISIPMLR